ncbi:phosphatase PAP2 family protein [Streptomyces albiaxialis]|uniref:Phosphatase PAP2 family protein n=1 Tax=Streptomyces albiaxialis TaxID=329523 RepID=A0ABN2WGE1_9ACTN
MPTRARPRWWTELPLIAAVYALYSAGRLLARGDETTAVSHGLALLRLERRLGIDAETPLNRAFVDHSWLGVPADFAYASLHFLVTPLVLAWLFRRHAAHYRFLRTWLTVSTLIGLVGFTLLPTCPPRLLDVGHGFTDTMALYSDYGWWGTEASAPRGLGGLTNQFAAMPSLHVGWALWCGAALWRLGPRAAWCRALAVAYPLATCLTVLGTANHYLLDAVAGAAVMGLGLLLTGPLLRCSGAVRARVSAAVPARRERAAGGRTGGTRRAADGSPEASAVSAGCQTAAGIAPSPEATADDPPSGQPQRPRQHEQHEQHDRRARLPRQRDGTASAAGGAGDADTAPAPR